MAELKANFPKVSVTNRQFQLVRIPDGPLTLDCFKLECAAIPEPKEGEVLLKMLYMSIDAANRAWMQGATYRDALGAGTVMAGRAVGEVIESRHPDFRTGADGRNASNCPRLQFACEAH